MNTTTDSVRVVLFDRENPGVFLILSESDDPDNLKLPGGKFNSADETPEAAVDRELREEIGFGARETDVHQVGELINDDGISKRYIFTGKLAADVVQPTQEVHEIRWVAAGQVPACKNHDHILSAVRLATNN